MKARREVAWLFLLFLLLQAGAALADDPAPDAAAESDRLFFEGRRLMTLGKTLEACVEFERSLALRRRGGALLNLAICREKAEEPVVAWRLFVEAKDFIGGDRQAERREVAEQHLAALREKIAFLSLSFAPGADTADLRITCDREAVAREGWGSPIPALPGAHVLTATSPGHEPFEVKVTLARPGDTESVQIPLLEARPAETNPPLPGREAPLPAPVAPPPGVGAASSSLRFGALARVDIDPIHPGARLAAGLTLELGKVVELGGSALIGRDLGVEPQATFFVLGQGAWRPLLNVGVPIFFDKGAQAGVRGALGLSWDVTRHLSFFAQVGGAYFSDAPTGIARAVFLPSLGAQGRL